MKFILLFSFVFGRHHQISYKSGKDQLCSRSCDTGVKQEIRLVPNGKLQEFYFCSTGDWACQSLFVYLERPAGLISFDCYCPGDVWQFFDNGEPIEAIGGRDCLSMESECANFDGNPESCQANYHNVFCSLDPEFPPILEAGKHNLTMRLFNSPYDFGKGFVALKECIEMCPAVIPPCECPTELGCVDLPDTCFNCARAACICEKNSDCPNGALCDKALGYCREPIPDYGVECKKIDNWCPHGLQCDFLSNSCLLPCEKDKDCPSGKSCRANLYCS